MSKLKITIPFLLIVTHVFIGCGDFIDYFEGITPLMKASLYGDYRKTKLLIENGAAVNAVDRYGESALTRAVRNSHSDIVDLLLQNNADIEVKTSTGWTSLMWACFNQDYKTAEILIKNKADINAFADDGSTALIKCIDRNTNIKLLELLLNSKAEVNDENGCSLPLVLACSKSINTDIKVIMLLVEFGANVHGTCNGDTALSRAIERGDYTIIDFIRNIKGVNLENNRREHKRVTS
jgi:ankyrin repeat protein